MKKRLFHSFTFFVCLFVFLSFSLNTASAKTYVTSGLVTKNWTCAQMSRGGYLTMDGQNVFCVEPHIIFKTNQKYEVSSSRPSYISESKAHRLGLISYYGTKYFQTERHYAASQSLIWIELGEPVSSSIFKVDGISVKPEMDEIIKLVDTHHLTPSFSDKTFTIEVGKTLEIEDTNQVLERFSIETIEGIDIKKSGNKLLITPNSNAPQVAKINVNHLADSQEGSTIYYKVPGTSEGNGWQICANFYVEEPVHSSFNLNIIHYEQPVLKTVQETVVEVDKKTICVTKKDSNTLQGLENTQIEIQVDHQPFASNLFTDSEGKVIIPFEKKYQAQSDVISYITNFEKISPENQEKYKGTFKSYDTAYQYALNQAKERLDKLINETSYTFTAIEQSPRIGYFSSNNQTSITTNENDIELYLQNTHQTLEIELLKIDKLKNTPIKDVEFGLYAKQDIIHPDGKTGILYTKDALVSKFEKTDDNGKTKLSNLYLGEYYIKELTTPQSYVTNINPININYTTTNTKIITTQITIMNQQTQVEFLKIDSDTNLPLPDAHLQLIDSNGKVIDQWISNNNAHLIDGLNRNEAYTLVETKAPLGYLLSKPITFIVEDTNDTQTITMENKYIYGKVTFNKIGEVFENYDEGFKIQPLEGSELSIYNHNDELVTILKSNQSTYLPYGSYFAKETKTPEGYLQDKTKYEFEVTSTDAQTITIENKHPTFEIVLKKQFEDNTDYFQEVSFGLYTSNDKLISTCPLDENGKLINVPKLPYGSYYLKELTTHPSYILDKTKYPFTTFYQDQHTTPIIIQINEGNPIINYLKKATLTLFKINEENQPLKGATFVLMNEKLEVIDKKTTDDMGQIIFNDLRLKTYYIKEINAPSGYQLNDEITEIKLDKDIQITFTNQLIPTKNTGDQQMIIPVLISGITSFVILIYLKKKKGRSLL